MTPCHDYPHAIAALENGTLHPPPHARVVRELVVHRRAELLLGHAPRQLRELAERRPFPRGVLLELLLRAVGLVQDTLSAPGVGPVHEALGDGLQVVDLLDVVERSSQ